MAEYDIDENDKDGWKRHDDRHVDGVGVAQREVEKEYEREEPHSATEEYSRIVGAGYAVGPYEGRSYPEENAAAAQTEYRDIERTHPFGNEIFHYRYVYTEEYRCQQYENIAPDGLR